jgi:hypothetical protein
MIFALAYQSIGDYSRPADGFCDQCPCGEGNHSEHDYRNEGHIFDFVRQAVVDELKVAGYEIADGFDQETGKELMAPMPFCKPPPDSEPKNKPIIKEKLAIVMHTAVRAVTLHLIHEWEALRKDQQ